MVTRFILFMYMPKTTFIIACEALRPELELLSQNMPHPPHFVYLKQGLHDTPDILRQTIQESISTLEAEYAPDSICLGYGLCGRGLSNLKAEKAILIVPRVHDCIPLLLGTGPENAPRTSEFGKTYWLSAGWLKYSQVEHIHLRQERYQQYIIDYGQDSADYLLEVELSWRQNYECTCLIYWENLQDENLRIDAHFVNDDMGLPYTERQGNPWYMQELVLGGTNLDNFYHISPGMSLDLDNEGMLAVVKYKSENE